MEGDADKISKSIDEPQNKPEKQFIHRWLSEGEKDKFSNNFGEHIKTTSCRRTKQLTHFFLFLFFVTLLLSIIEVVLHIQESTGYFMIHTAGFIYGILAIQLHFIFSHMWVHALMFEYDLWFSKDLMDKEFGIDRLLPPVMWDAFYHHHAEHTDIKWLENRNKDNTYYTGPFATLISHWESYFLFTMSFPYGFKSNTILWFILTFYSQYRLDIFAGFLLGYQIGVILLPINHSWVHSKISISPDESPYYLCILYKILEHFLRALEWIGIIATSKDHKSHHDYDSPGVYKNFTSSGLYSRILNEYIDKLWLENFNYAIHNNVKMHVIMENISSKVLLCLIGLPFALILLFYVVII